MNYNTVSGTNMAYLFRILSGTIFMILLWFLVKAYFSRRRVVQQLNQLPSLKLKWYMFHGHAYIPFRYMLKRSTVDIPFNAYLFMFINGVQHIFSKGNLTSVSLFTHPLFIVYKSDSVEMALNSKNSQEKAWVYRFMECVLGTGLLTSDGELNKNRRKLISPGFHVSVLKDFLPVLTKNSNILVDVFKSHTQDKFVDIFTLVTRCSFDNVCESILGTGIHAQTQETARHFKALSDISKRFIRMIVNPCYWNEFLRNISPFGRKLRNEVNFINQVTDKLISQKREEKRQEIVGPKVVRMEHAEEDTDIRRKKMAMLDLLLEDNWKHNSLSADDIRDEVTTFTLSGYDTTAIAMSWTLYLIGLHPWVQQKIHEELDSIFGEDSRDATVDDIKDMKYMECVIKESLRLYPPAPERGRRVEEDIEFQGRTLLRGSTIMVHIYKLHQDPEVFHNPEKFDPERFSPENSVGRHPYAYIPFSMGSRNCIGQKFAMLQLKTVLSTILRTFKIRSLDPRDKVICAAEIILKPTKKLRIQVRKRDQDFDFHSVYYYL